MERERLQIMDSLYVERKKERHESKKVWVNTNLRFCLLPDQYDVTCCVMNGEVRQVEAFPHHLLQLSDDRRAQEQERGRLGQVHHLALQLHVLEETNTGSQLWSHWLLSLRQKFLGEVSFR